MRRFWYSEAIRGSRLVAPPTWSLFAFAIVLLLFEGIAWRVGGRWQMGGGQLAVQPPELGIPAVLVLGAAAVMFGIYRVAAFHPCLRNAYRDWLVGTCWRSPQPLPLGPVTLTIGDGLLLLLPTGWLWVRHPDISPLRAVLLFSAAYLACLAFALLKGGPRAMGYAVVFGLGGILLTAPEPPLQIAIVVATYLVAWGGLRRSLVNLRLPSTNGIDLHIVTASTSGVRAVELSPVFAGWPFGYLGPKRTLPRQPAFDALCISVLAGWLLAALMRFFIYLSGGGLRSGDDTRVLVVGAFAMATLLASMRMLVYALHHRPPISVRGRLFTLRWIIPSYDRAFAAPVASLLVLWEIGPRLLNSTEPPSIAGAASLLALAMIVALVPGPRFRDWSLTCECRIAPQKPPPMRQA